MPDKLHACPVWNKNRKCLGKTYRAFCRSCAQKRRSDLSTPEQKRMLREHMTRIVYRCERKAYY